MTSEQKRNYIILAIILILVIGGIYYKKYKSNPSLDLPFSGEENNVPPDKGEDKGVVSEPILTYEQYLQQGINLETKGEFLKAVDSYKKASELSPTEYVPYSNAGSVYYNLKKYTEAEDHFLKALELSPSSVSVYTKLYEVYFYGMKRNKEQMTAFFQDALKNTNNDINIVRMYAIYLEEIAQYESALAIWQSLLKFEPDNASYKAKVEALQKKING